MTSFIKGLPSHMGVLPPNYYAMAAMQMVPGHLADNRVGHSDVINTTRMLLSNVTSAARPFNFPAAAQQMQVVSTSANDAAAGTGVQQVEIEYLTSPTSIEPFKRKEEIVTMNGVGAVLTNAKDIYRVDYFRSARTGTGMQSAGNISLQSVGGATTWELIESGYNVNRTGIHFVEKGFMCLVTDMAFSVSTNAGVRFTISHTDEIEGNSVRHAAMALEMSNTSIQKPFNTGIMTANLSGQEHYVCMLVSGKAANQVAAGTFSFIDMPL